jgi:thioredoxin 1
VIDEIAEEQGSQALVAKLNVDHSPVIAARYGITSIPALIVFKNGQPVTRLRGLQTKSTLLRLIREAV